MTNAWISLLTLIAGMGIGCQAAINGALGRKVGSIEGALISFFVGTVGLTLFMIFFGKGNPLEVFKVPKWQLLGGLLGAVYIAIMVMSVPKIGVAASVIAVIVGQIAISLAIDHFGWFGNARIPVDGQRILGLIFLFAALFLIFRVK